MKFDTINTYYVEGTKSDLERASSMIKKIKNEINSIDSIDTAHRLNFKIKTEVILYAVGDMSIPLTKRHDSMRDEYMKKYDDKKEAQTKFLKDYYALHKPYDKIKSACWKILFSLKGLSEDGEPIKK